MAPKSAHPAWVQRVVAIAVGVFVVQFVVVYILGNQSAPPIRSVGLSAPVATTASTSPRPTSIPSAAAFGAGLRGPGIDTPGIYLRFDPRSDGTFDVSERVVFRTATNSVVLTPPARGGASDIFARSQAVLRGLQMEVGGQPVDGLPERVSTADTVRLRTNATALTLRYQLDGTSVLSKPSTAGRALAYIRPVTAGIDPSLPVQLHAAGKGTLNLGCPQLPTAKQGCARGTAPHFAVASGLTGATSTVVIQLDLS